MIEIKRTMIASLLIEQSTELKGKRPSELGFEELVDVVQAVVKNCSIPDVSHQRELLINFLNWHDSENLGCLPEGVEGRIKEYLKLKNRA